MKVKETEILAYSIQLFVYLLTKIITDFLNTRRYGSVWFRPPPQNAV